MGEEKRIREPPKGQELQTPVEKVRSETMTLVIG